MKWLPPLLVLCGLVRPAFANSIQIVKRDLGGTFYRQYTSVFHRTAEPGSGALTVSFSGRTGMLPEIWNLQVSKKEYVDCDLGICSTRLFQIPLSLERLSCQVHLQLRSNSGQEVLRESLAWGNCEDPGPLPDQKLRADLIFIEGSPSQDLNQVQIKNTGHAIYETGLAVWGLLFNSAGDVIWRKAVRETIDLEEDGTLNVKLGAPLKNWQTKLGCRLHLIIDPNGEIPERTKKNNDLHSLFGDCEDAPSAENGDLPNLVPYLTIAGNEISATIKNTDRLGIDLGTTSIETRLMAFDVSGHLLREITVFSEGPLHGFGDEKEIHLLPIPTGTCRVEFEVNPQHTIRESNFFDNRKELSICK